MKYMQETTNWNKCEYNVPNHIYMLSGWNCYGYIKAGSGERVEFAKPFRIDTRNRTFKEVDLK